MIKPRITFGMIVLNGEPFTRYNLRALYPFAHEIIVVEGACAGAADVATPTGHSTDGTLEILRRFKQEEDIEHKLTIVVAEDEGKPNGFWSEKDEMSQAYARRATGNYLWQIDVDEFYQPEDMAFVLDLLSRSPQLQMVTFKQITFWGSLDYWTDSFLLRRGATIYRRLFKWGPGYSYSTHRPPTVLNEQGRPPTNQQIYPGKRLAQKHIYLYHYSLLFPHEVKNKSVYYENAEWAKVHGARAWSEQISEKIIDPFRVHNCFDYISWLERFYGKHPPEIRKMWEDILAHRLDVRLRAMDDVEHLMRDPQFLIKRAALKKLSLLDTLIFRLRSRWARFRQTHGILTPKI